MLGVIDYGMSNLHSIFTKMKKLDVPACRVSKPEQLQSCSKFILPGVGHFTNGMNNLNKNGLASALSEEILVVGKPILGICLGVQLFCVKSEEGDCKGLGWIDARVTKFDQSRLPSRLKIPHIGWNTVCWEKDHGKKHSLNDMYYFVHSYHLTDVEKDTIAGISNYGYDFVSAIQKDNIYGLQFHPEKSHAAGLSLLASFVSG